ncbi:Cobyrinic acid ac-diamide synthase [Thalassoporum mexicanum PCC 7367]|uniref:AAA family ATPase n=1 Tax=Thalassoporum mexicanum TaxID=3457544 RepID=UPI00029F9D4C|nr:AAA family ATPase [Pseudanabaena sp. PCC 7367]AFY70393.1 Cobyrinic acid ac-diamide synthase [Pseudanabaena sp. PCC 7367]
MSVIVFINQKGGCGKSTTSVHFAYWLAKQSGSVAIVDADAQQSSSQWVEGINQDIPYFVIQSPDDLLEKVPQVVTEYQHVVIDGPASIAETTRAILFRADLAVIPCQPTGVDLRSTSDAVRLVKQAQSVRGGPPMATVFLSRAVKGTKLKDEALQLLAQVEGVKLLNSIIHQKQAIADTSGQSATVWDLSSRPAKESALEYADLFTEIMELLP